MNLKTLLSITAASTALICSSCTNKAGAANAADTSTALINYPIAKPMVDPKTGAPVKDHYVSPFRPYNPIVAKGFKSGQLAGDPSTIKVDPKTGKPNKDTIKVFKLP